MFTNDFSQTFTNCYCVEKTSTYHCIQGNFTAIASSKLTSWGTKSQHHKAKLEQLSLSNVKV